MPALNTSSSFRSRGLLTFSAFSEFSLMSSTNVPTMPGSSFPTLSPAKTSSTHGMLPVLGMPFSGTQAMSTCMGQMFNSSDQTLKSQNSLVSPSDCQKATLPKQFITAPQNIENSRVQGETPTVTKEHMCQFDNCREADTKAFQPSDTPTPSYYKCFWQDRTETFPHLTFEQHMWSHIGCQPHRCHECSLDFMGLYSYFL